MLNQFIINKHIPEIHNTARIMFIYKKDKNQLYGNTLEDFRPINI